MNRKKVVATHHSRAVGRAVRRMAAAGLAAVLILCAVCCERAAAQDDAPTSVGSAPKGAARAPAATVQPQGEPSPAPIQGSDGAGRDLRLPHDLSPVSMFLDADIVVKAVMVGLAFASVVTWTIWFAKGLELLASGSRERRALRRLAEAADLAAFETRGRGRRGRRSGPVTTLVLAAREEADRSADLPTDGVKERAILALNRIEARAARAMGRGTGLVATIGSTAPFVGLFGTVWGIMDSFVGISQAHASNLAVVAPGIAEALLATAIGLVAAIPAVIIYNTFARSIAGYRALLSDASSEVLRHLSRDLDRRLRAPAE